MQRTSFALVVAVTLALTGWVAQAGVVTYYLPPTGFAGLTGDDSTGTPCWWANVNGTKIEQYLTWTPLAGIQPLEGKTVNDILSIRYSTYDTVAGDGRDWYLNIMTVPLGVGDYSWFRSAFTAEPDLSTKGNPVNTSNSWQQWDTAAGGFSQLRFDRIRSVPTGDVWYDWANSKDVAYLQSNFGSELILAASISAGDQAYTGGLSFLEITTADTTYQYVFLPEPAAASLLLLAGVGLVLRRPRRR